MAEEVEGVIVDQEAAIGLTHYLTEIGRLGNRTARDVGAAIQSSVNAQWGSAKIKGFQDKEGPGWVIDMTDKFEGEVVYAIVRTSKGKRHVVKTVGEDELRSMVAAVKKSAPPRQAEPDPAINPASAIKSLQAANEQLMEENRRLTQSLGETTDALADAMKYEPTPDGPALLRWIAPESLSDNEVPEEMNSEEIITVGEVGSRIGELISRGVDPQNIEVWSQRKQPKIKVELE